MKNTRATPVVLLAALLATAGAQAQGMQGRHAHAFAPDVDAFHNVLAPLWHAPAGAGRSRQTCAQADRLEALAKDIRSGNAQALQEALADLSRQCRTDPEQIDAAFARVHEAFHHLAEPRARQRQARPAAPADAAKEAR